MGGKDQQKEDDGPRTRSQNFEFITPQENVMSALSSRQGVFGKMDRGWVFYLEKGGNGCGD